MDSNSDFEIVRDEQGYLVHRLTPEAQARYDARLAWYEEKARQRRRPVVDIETDLV